MNNTSTNAYVSNITTSGRFLYRTKNIKMDNNHKVKMIEPRGFPFLSGNYETLINMENDLYYKCDNDGLQTHIKEFESYCILIKGIFKAELDTLQLICNSICEKTGECLYYIVDEDQITTSELRLSCMPHDKIYLYYKLFNDYMDLIKLIMGRILNYLDSNISARKSKNDTYYNNNKMKNNKLHIIPR